MVDYQGATAAFVDRSRVFQNNNQRKWLVIHKTAGAGSALDIAHFFQNDPNMASTHYVVDQAGRIAQCVLEQDGAAGNCCLEAGHASFLPTGTNLNWWTISIEHVDPTSDNSTPLTEAQKQASFKLIRDICQRNKIPMRKGDANGGIIGHKDIAPISRARCPGNYPWDELFQFLESGNEEETMLDVSSVSQFFSEQGGIWKCKNGNQIIGAMLDFFRKSATPLALIGLPKTNELSVDGHPGVKIQVFERIILCYDPGHVLDSPPGAGAVYAMHIDSISSLAVVQLLKLLNIQVQQPAPDTTDLKNQLSIANGALSTAQAALTKAQASVK